VKSTELASSFTQRFRRLSTWGAILGFGVVWIPARLMAGLPYERMGAWEFFVPALFAAGHLALSAAPWQWTGDSKPAAPLWRGLLQAIPWNAGWVFLLMWGVEDHVRPARPEPRRAPQPLIQEQQPQSPEGAPRRRLSGDEPPPQDRGEERAPPPKRNDAERPPRPRLEGEEAPPPRNNPLEDRSKPPPTNPRPELMLLFLNFPFALVLGWFLSEKERVERKEALARERERQARARALQSQLHPHVLFNVLGGLTELVHEDPDAAEEALVGLTELLRMLMQHGAALSLPLGQERALLRRYLGIEAIRLGPRLEVQWTWDEKLDGILVPPLLLQPLVENAVKHGISPSPEGGVLRIDAVRTGSGLLLRVSNSGCQLEKGGQEGTGLSNLRERLALLPEPRPAFDLRQEGSWTVAELRFEGTLGA
jgi:hypothetical protein